MEKEGPKHKIEVGLFSPNDIAFLKGVVEGKSIEEVAKSIGVKPGTVKAYKGVILRSYRELFPTKDPMAMAVFTALVNGLLKPVEFSWDEHGELDQEEEQISSRLLMGKPDFVIASEVGVQISVVDEDIRRICQKIGTNNRYGIIVFAYKKASESLDKGRQ